MRESTKKEKYIHLDADENISFGFTLACILFPSYFIKVLGDANFYLLTLKFKIPGMVSGDVYSLLRIS